MVDVLHDASNTAGSFSGAANLSIPLTIAANSDRYLIVHIMQSRLSGGLPPTITAAAWNGGAESLTKLWEVENAGNQRLAAWGLKNPSAGAFNVDLTFAAVADTRIAASASSYYNVNQTTPLSAVYNTIVMGGISTAAPRYVVGNGSVGVGDLGVTACGGHASASLNISPALGAPPLFGATGTPTNVATGTSITPALVTAANRFAGTTHFAIVGTKNNEVHSCATSGWQKLDQWFHPSGNLTFSLWYCRQVDATVPSAPTVTWATSVPNMGQCFSAADVDFDNPPAVTIVTGTGNTSPHGTPTTATSASRNGLGVYIDVAAANTAAGAPAGGWTEVDDSAGSAAGMRIVIGNKQINAGANSGVISITGAVADWIQVQLLFATPTFQTERADLAGVGTSTLFVALNVSDEVGTATPVVGYNSNAPANTTCLGGGVTLKVAAAGLTVSAPLYTNAQTLFAPKVAMRYGAPLHTNAQQFFAPKIIRRLSAPFHTNAQQFFTPIKLRVTLKLAARFNTQQQFFSPSLVHAPTPGQVEPPFFTNLQEFYGPTLLHHVMVRPSFYQATQEFYGPTIYRLQRVSAPFHINAQAFFDPTIARLQKLTAPFHENTQVFFGPEIIEAEPGLVVVPFHQNAQVFYGPRLLFFFPPEPPLPGAPGALPGDVWDELRRKKKKKKLPVVEWNIPPASAINAQLAPPRGLVITPEFAREVAKLRVRMARAEAERVARIMRERHVEDQMIETIVALIKGE